MDKAPICVLFVSQSDYDNFLSVNEDRDKLPKSYAVWLKATNEFLENQHRIGVTTIKVQCDPFAFRDWCLSQKCRIDTNARKAYAAWLGSRFYVNGTSQNKPPMD